MSACRIRCAWLAAACAAMAYLSAAHADSLEAQLTGSYWHAARSVSLYGQPGYVYADMKFHADGYWTQFYRSYMPGLPGCHQVGDEVISVGRWRLEGGHIVIIGSRPGDPLWTNSATVRFVDGYLEVEDGLVRFEPATSIAGGFGCQGLHQPVFEEHAGFRISQE